MKFTWKEKLEIAGAIAAVGLLGATIWYEEKKSLSPSATPIAITPADTGKIFSIPVGQRITISTPQDPTGVVTYGNFSNPKSGTLALIDDSIANGVEVVQLIAIAAGTVNMSFDVLTNGTKTGSVSWTIIVLP